MSENDSIWIKKIVSSIETKAKNPLHRYKLLIPDMVLLNVSWSTVRVTETQKSFGRTFISDLFIVEYSCFFQ